MSCVRLWAVGASLTPEDWLTAGEVSDGDKELQTTLLRAEYLGQLVLAGFSWILREWLLLASLQPWVRSTSFPHPLPTALIRKDSCASEAHVNPPVTNLPMCHWCVMRGWRPRGHQGLLSLLPIGRADTHCQANKAVGIERG